MTTNTNSNTEKKMAEKLKLDVTSKEHKLGYYGEFGGQFVNETLKKAMDEIAIAYEEAKKDPGFQKEFQALLKDYSGRATPLYFAEKLTEKLGGAKVYLKREDLNHLGAHKLNNVLGQMLLAKRMGKTRIIAETGAGQHGVATAAAAARFGLECVVYMGQEDCERQKLNVFRMELLGAKVVSVKEGTQTLKDAVDAAFADFSNNLDTTFYIIGSAVGPYPYPMMVKDFQSVISQESKEQILAKEGRLPDTVIACVGGGSNAIGSFAAYIPENKVQLIGVEAAGKGVDTPYHAATMTKGTIGIMDGMNTYGIFDELGNVAPVYSISAGLDYPGVGPEHAYLKETKRAEYVPVTDQEAVEAFLILGKTEGIIPAIESSHAIAEALKRVPLMDKEQIVLVTVSGRGDKDVEQVAKYLGMEI